MNIDDRGQSPFLAQIKDEAIEAAVRLSHRYITDRFLPDKAIDLMDEAASKVRMKALAQPTAVKELEERLETMRREKEAAITAQEYERAAQIRDEEAGLKAEASEYGSRYTPRTPTDPNYAAEIGGYADLAEAEADA